MRMPGVRLRLWHAMAVVAFTGAVVATYVWLASPGSPPDLPPSAIIVSRSRILIVGGYHIPDTSPAFPIILCLASTVMVGLPVGLIALIVWVGRVIGRRIGRNA
jgi:hypothetical protein